MSGVGHLELLLWANGNSNTDEQSLSIQIALHHPFSQGRVYINSSDPFDDPIIDPQYFSHFADLISLREGIKLVRKIGQSPPMKDVLPEELSPGPGVTSDQDIEAFLLNDVESQYHPGNTLAMLPRNSGGVVDAKLKVYGLGNVRVVDSSVFPLSLAAHVRPLSPSMFFHFPTCFFSSRPQCMRSLNMHPISFAMTGNKDRHLTARTPDMLVSSLLSRSPWLPFSPYEPRPSAPNL